MTAVVEKETFDIAEVHGGAGYLTLIVETHRTFAEPGDGVYLNGHKIGVVESLEMDIAKTTIRMMINDFHILNSLVTANLDGEKLPLEFSCSKCGRLY